MKSPIISFDQFNSLLGKDYVLIEAGYDKLLYEKEHLNGALYIDLNDDLSEIPLDPKNGGRHPLPSIDVFISKLQMLGIAKETRVIIYDRNFGANSASRFWWMLTALGVNNVQVLSGGFEYAEKQGFKTTDEIKLVHPVKEEYNKEWQHPMILMNELKSKIELKKKVKILDVRSSKRHKGDSEPIDPIAGAIPSSVNVFFKENLNEDGTFKTKEKLNKIYQSIVHEENDLIVHCGSGVTACHTILSIVASDLPMPKLYVGSWSEWCRNK